MAASGSQRPCWAGVPPGDLSSYSSRPTFKPAADTYRGYLSHSLCQLVDQPRTAGRPVDTFGCLSKVEPERLPTVSVDHRNATCRPAALLVAALPHCQASSPPDGSSGSTTSGHRRPAMAFLTHLETPQAAESLLAAAVRSHPSWERSRKRVEQSGPAFRESKGGYLNLYHAPNSRDTNSSGTTDEELSSHGHIRRLSGTAHSPPGDSPNGRSEAVPTA